LSRDLRHWASGVYVVQFWENQQSKKEFFHEEEEPERTGTGDYCELEAGNESAAHR
jgi:hypothetical protein